MLKNLVFLIFFAGSSVSSPLKAEEQAEALVGSWKLTAYQLQFAGEDISEPFGKSAKGSLVLTGNGRWIIMLALGERKPASSEAERSALLGTMVAYTGKYTTEGDKISTRVDATWNEMFSGKAANQTRFFKVDGDSLIIRSPEMDSSVRPGKRVVSLLGFEREK